MVSNVYIHRGWRAAAAAARGAARSRRRARARGATPPAGCRAGPSRGSRRPLWPRASASASPVQGETWTDQ